jgi:hypothetical protein
MGYPQVYKFFTQYHSNAFKWKPEQKTHWWFGKFPILMDLPNDLL